jgi:hypothetical protein
MQLDADVHTDSMIFEALKKTGVFNGAVSEEIPKMTILNPHGDLSNDQKVTIYNIERQKQLMVVEGSKERLFDVAWSKRADGNFKFEKFIDLASSFVQSLDLFNGNWSLVLKMVPSSSTRMCFKKRQRSH